MRKINKCLFFFALVLIYGCKTSELLPGYIINPAPNNADKPGRVYRLDNENKTDILVEYLDINPTPQAIFISESSREKKVNVSALLNFVAKSSEVNANTELALEQRSNFEFKLKDTEVIKISDADLRPLFAGLVNQIKEDIELFGLKDPKYFIVREAVTAKEILIKSSRNFNNEAEFKAKVDSYINGNSNIQWTNNSKDELKVTLEKGVFVFYKPEQIILRTSAAGDTKISFKEASDDDLIKLETR